MSKKTLSPKTTPPFQRRQGPPRLLTVGASVDANEQTDIYNALHDAGFKSASEGARVVLLAWARGETMPLLDERRQAERRESERRKPAA